MRRIRAALTVPLLLLAVGPLSAADLTKIDRSIGREPKYRHGAPKYCLLVFGPEAKFRVWIVRDGSDTYVDRNGNGDVTEKEEMVPNSGNCGTVVEPNGTQHKNLRVYTWTKGMRMMLDVRGTLKQLVGYDRENPLLFADRAKDAPIVHFGGPLEIRFYRDPPTLTIGENQIDLAIGTPGLGKGTLAAVGCCNLPEKVYPRARFEAATSGGRTFVTEVNIGDD